MSSDSEREYYIRRAHSNRRIWDQFVKDTSSSLRAVKQPVIAADSENYAVIIEPRIHQHLEYVLRNVMYFLGNGWGLQIFAGQSNYSFVKKLVSDWGDVRVHRLDFETLKRHQFRNLRKSANFWETIPGENLLCFETDSILCRRGIEEFLEYDYVGAPWDERCAPSPKVRVGNGGLSFRRKTTMIEICESIQVDRIESEDCFFSMHLQLNREKYRVPDLVKALEFSVETMFFENPLGIHKAWEYLSEEEFRSILHGIVYK